MLLRSGRSIHPPPPVRDPGPRTPSPETSPESSEHDWDVSSEDTLDFDLHPAELHFINIQNMYKRAQRAIHLAAVAAAQDPPGSGSRIDYTLNSPGSIAWDGMAPSWHEPCRHTLRRLQTEALRTIPGWEAARIARMARLARLNERILEQERLDQEREAQEQ
jgi:hypothetical protein